MKPLLEYSMIVKLLTEHHLEFLGLKGGCRGSSESTLVKMSNCWKSHARAQIMIFWDYFDKTAASETDCLSLMNMIILNQWLVGGPIQAEVVKKSEITLYLNTATVNSLSTSGHSCHQILANSFDWSGLKNSRPDHNPKCLTRTLIFLERKFKKKVK